MMRNSLLLLGELLLGVFCLMTSSARPGSYYHGGFVYWTRVPLCTG